MSSNPFGTPGAFSWSELVTTDVEAAKAFYGKVFGWELEAMQAGDIAYNVVKVQGQGMGGIMAMPPTMPKEVLPHWGVYITVADTDATAKKVEQLGGGVLVPPTDIPGVGRFAVLRDPQGAVFSVMRYGMGG